VFDTFRELNPTFDVRAIVAIARTGCVLDRCLANRCHLAATHGGIDRAEPAGPTGTTAPRNLV
jgi:hypothetical protein